MNNYKNFKKSIDYLASFLILIFLLPVFLIIIVYIIIFIGRPIIFKQKRPGLNGKPFEIYKFRTMIVNKELAKDTKNDFLRLNKYGKFLRSTSLDELPSLINVLKGEMSFIGPRPLLMEYLNLYSEKQKKRHNVKPGITGLAQISGRNKLTWEEKFNKDVYYVNNMNFFLDLKILFLTFLKVILRNGINSSERETCKPFTGNKN